MRVRAAPRRTVKGSLQAPFCLVVRGHRGTQRCERTCWGVSERKSRYVSQPLRAKPDQFVFCETRLVRLAFCASYSVLC